jgi:methionyl-tRNA formyltransferase
LNIIFAGTPAFAAASLTAILEAGHKVIAVYTQPDRPAGRGKKLVKSEVKQLAEAHQIPVYQPEKLNQADDQQALAALQPDLMVVAAYGLLLPKQVLAIPRFGCVNIHASLLPRWRGAAPIQRAIQAGDKETGITIMQMDEGLDTGDMLLKRVIPIGARENAASLHDRLAAEGAQAILDYLARRDTLQPEKQQDTEACYARKLSKQEAQINWQLPAQQLERNILAFNPVPVAYFELEDQRVRVFDAQAVDYRGSETAGTILQKDKHGILVRCAEQALLIRNLQLPGAKAMPVDAFINGGKNLLNPGEQLSSPNDMKTGN